MDKLLSLFPLLVLKLAATSGTFLTLQPPGQEHAFFTNESFFVTCFVRKDAQAIRLAWTSPSGRDITVSEGRVHVEPTDKQGAEGLELVVEEVRYEDHGVYTCSAIVDGGLEVRTSFRLHVYRSITFIDTPPVQYASEGEDLAVYCHVYADPEPIVSWYINNAPVVTDGRVEVVDEGLLIHHARRQDTANYTCRAVVVTPQSSQLKEVTIDVQVQFKPEWVKPPMIRAYSQKDTWVSLRCGAIGNPAPSFEWYRDDVLLRDGDLLQISSSSNHSVLQVWIQDDSVFGEYICRAYNIMGELERPIFLQPGARPKPPSLSILSEDPGTLQLSLQSQPSTLPTLAYRVQYRPLGEPWGTHTEEFKQDDLYLLENLNLDTEYQLRASSRNAAGFSEYSSPLTHRTRGLEPEGVTGTENRGQGTGSAPECFPYPLTTMLTLLILLAPS